MSATLILGGARSGKSRHAAKLVRIGRRVGHAQNRMTRVMLVSVSVFSRPAGTWV